MPALPNLLATRFGRLVAFFALYMTEGLPLGFAATAVATQLTREGVGSAEVGAFIASQYVPWAFKWAFGPIVDVFSWERFGRRRSWILITQVLMALTLLSTVLLKLPEQLWLFTAILLVHNTFGATQDVAIDALACNTLKPEERGLANGVMFAGANVGMLLGGGGVLFLADQIGFQSTFFFVAGAIFSVTLLTLFCMREAAEPRAAVVGSKLVAAGREMHTFAINAFRSFLGSRGALAGLFFSLLPAGAISMGIIIVREVGVGIGMTDTELAKINATSSAVGAGFCVFGGYLSDRFGRRRMLSLFILLMSLPVLYFAMELQRVGWIMPTPAGEPRPEAPPGLGMALWIAALSYSAFQGLMYGTRSAIMMDVTNPIVAGTQFTAYMALANLAIAFSSTWQTIAIGIFGYPKTMLIDAILGCVCVALIPLLRKPRTAAGGDAFMDGGAPVRAKWLAVVLGVLCLSYLPAHLFPETLGKAAPIVGTLHTLVFVGSAVFLLAGGAVISPSARVLARVGACIAPLLLAMHGRYYTTDIAQWAVGPERADALADALRMAFLVPPVLGAAVLLALAFRPWRELRSELTPEPTVVAAQ